MKYKIIIGYVLRNLRLSSFVNLCNNISLIIEIENIYFEKYLFSYLLFMCDTLIFCGILFGHQHPNYCVYKNMLLHLIITRHQQHFRLIDRSTIIIITVILTYEYTITDIACLTCQLPDTSYSVYTIKIISVCI